MWAVEDDEQGQLLVRREPVLGSRRDEERHALRQGGRGALDLEHPTALEHDVHLVLVVRLLAVGLRGDEHVDADLEPRRAVHHLVAAAAGDQCAPGLVDVERLRPW